MAKQVCKVARFELKCLMDAGNHMRYPYHELPALQQEVSQAKNRTVQACWEWYNIEVAFQSTQGTKPYCKAYTGMSLEGYINSRLKGEFSQMYSQNLSCAVRSAVKAFQKALPEVRAGKRSVLSYRADAPIEVHNQRIQLRREGQKYYVSLNLFSRKYAREKEYSGTAMEFELFRPGGSQRAIIERCMLEDPADKYSIGESELIYNKKKRCWFLNLTYKFTPRAKAPLDPEKIMGVDLGIQCVAYMGFNFCADRFFIGRSEVEAFRSRTEARRRALQKQGKYCGEGRIGHGYATRVRPALHLSDAIKRFRDTANHKYSRYIVQKALEFGCGTIQMENLQNVKGGENEKFLRDWTYFDLRQKIQYKAEEAGIEFRLVDPRYTSQRCSQCGHIDKNNRPKWEKGQAFFACTNCGFSANADYNASLNLATKDIEKIIKETLCAKGK